ncbi:DUF4942 domain-containing protein [Bellilinea sp.]|uniref:DUF4942 domain-containing protein n=1 Tax=Bellilinea sp. TaxID=2838785 RepID=UPI002ADD7B74|nr:DUF4942 domain-containing protein [Bellilinea sp.]
MSVVSIQKPYTITEVLAIYRTVKQEIEAHGKEIQRALELAEASGLGMGGDYAVRFMEERLLALKQHTWRALLTASGVEKVLSVSRLERFEDFLRGNGYGYQSVPEPSEEAVQELLAGGAAKELFAEMIRESFDFLRPGTTWHSQYKTNKKTGVSS